MKLELGYHLNEAQYPTRPLLADAVVGEYLREAGYGTGTHPYFFMEADGTDIEWAQSLVRFFKLGGDVLDEQDLVGGFIRLRKKLKVMRRLEEMLGVKIGEAKYNELVKFFREEWK